MATNFDDLTIQSDFIFKKVMSRKHICKRLLEELLQIKIADISYPDVEYSLEPRYDSRGIRLDIIVDDDKRTRYNLEMQVRNKKNPATNAYTLPKRTRYYQALIDIDSMQKGQDYDELPATYVIFICLFDFFGEGSYTYTFKKRCLEDLSVELGDEATTIIVNTLGTRGEVSSNLKSFCEYVNRHVITSNFTKDIDAEINEIKLNKKVRKEYMKYEADVTDWKNEGIAIGMAKGKAEGLAKGKTQGILETAKRFLAMGLDLDDIARGTGLSVEALKKLQGELKLQG